MSAEKTAAVEELWNRMHVRLCHFICARMADEQDAEDILQEVFIRIHTHLDQVREMDRLEAWVYQVARNSIIDAYRSSRPGLELPEDMAEEPEPEADAQDELSPFVQELVKTLPDPYRQALILTEYQGLSQQQLAARLGISLSGAKSRVQRARHKIKDAMLTCCHFEFDARGRVLEVRKHCCCCAEA